MGGQKRLNTPTVILYLSLLMIPHTNTVDANKNDVSPFGFLSVGDWGSAALGGYHLRNAHDTASAMKAYIAQKTQFGQDPPSFVLNTGDNFYYCGIQNTSDPQISEDYTALFGGLGLTWYHSLGNHDYGFSPEAQLALNETIPGWIMDARYYHRRVMLGGGSDGDSIVVNIVVLDTNPCVSDYRGTDRQRWDPCGTEYPDCSPVAEPCHFHDNIISQDCDAQLMWAKDVLANITSASMNASTNSREWIVVVGHHKAEEIDVADFQTEFLDDPRVHLYLNGHTHNLEHYEIKGQAKYMTTGAGGMVIIGEDDESFERFRPTITNNGVRSLWSKVVTGFTSHTFMNNGTTLRTEFWDAKKNDSIYSFDVHI